MTESILAKEIIDPLKKEIEVKPIEIKVFSQLINKKEVLNDSNEIAKELYDQLVDTKEKK